MRRLVIALLLTLILSSGALAGITSVGLPVPEPDSTPQSTPTPTPTATVTATPRPHCGHAVVAPPPAKLKKPAASQMQVPLGACKDPRGGKR